MGDGESGDSLVDDNEPIQPLQQQHEEDYSDPNWEPAPIDAGPGMCAIVVLKKAHPHADDLEFRTNKPSDVISTLVSIYDSKEVFVKELQILLAQRLLAISDGNYEKEVCSVSLSCVIASLNTRFISDGTSKFSRSVSENRHCKYVKSCCGT